jgi:hypothetical protein
MTIVGLFFAVMFALFFGFLIKWLWNWLMPVLFELPEINYWQAVGILVLCKLLFGSFGSSCCKHSHKGRHGHGFASEKFKHKMKQRCNGFHGKDEDDFWKPKGSHENWKYYEQYWKDEGKEAFEAYIERIQDSETDEREDETEKKE